METDQPRITGETGTGHSADLNQQWLPARLVTVLFLCLIVRLSLVAWLHGLPLYVADERDYDELAINLVRHKEYAFQPGKPTSLRPPFYPLVVATTYAAAGEQNYTAVRLLQTAMGLATAWLVFLLARSLYDEQTAIFAAALYAFYPSLLTATGLILTESLFTLLLVGACLLMQRYLSGGGIWRLATFTAVLALAALTRSVLWLFPPVLVLFLAACSPQPRVAYRLTRAALALAIFAVVIAPWAYRNTALQKTFTAVDVMGGRNFMMGNYEHTPLDRPWDAISMSGDKAWHALVRRRFPDAGKITQGQLDKLAMRYGLEYVLAHPAQTIRRDIAKVFHFWQLERETIAGLDRGYWGQLSRPFVLLLAAIVLAAYTGILVSGVFGALMRPPAQWAMHVFLMLVIAFVCGIHTIVFAHSRYHLPLMPLVCIYAAAAWTGRDAIRRQWNRPTFWAAAGVCGVLATSWCCELWLEMARF